MSGARWTSDVSNLLRLGVIAFRAKLIGGSVREQMPQWRSVFLQIPNVARHNACTVVNRILFIVGEFFCAHRGVLAGTRKAIQSRRGPHWFSTWGTKRANHYLTFKDEYRKVGSDE